MLTMDNKRSNLSYHNRNMVSVNCKSDKWNGSLVEEFNYNCRTFWDTVPKACVIFKVQSAIVTAAKELIAGLFLKGDWNKILALALDLAFYAKCSSTEPGFLYKNTSKFFASPPLHNDSEIVVNLRLENRNWYERWIQTPSTTPLEGELRTFLSEPRNDAGISLVGPWLATVLLRLDKHRPVDVANKISKLFTHVYVADEIPDFHWSDEFSKEFDVLLKGFWRIELRSHKAKKLALYRIMIETAFHTPDERAPALLQFTTLQSLQFGGMMLVTLVRDILEERRLLKLDDIINATRKDETIRSWLNYRNYLTFFEDMSEEDRYYAMYAREFDANVFKKLSLVKNMKLCNYLAVLIDIGRKDQCFSVSNAGLVYQKLTLNRPNIEPLTDEDFRFCTIAADILLMKECIPKDSRSGAVITRSYLLRAQQYEKLADEAFLIARFQKKRAERFRSAAEDYIKKYGIDGNLNE